MRRLAFLPIIAALIAIAFLSVPIAPGPTPTAPPQPLISALISPIPSQPQEPPPKPSPFNPPSNQSGQPVEPQIYENLRKEGTKEGFSYTFTVNGTKYAAATITTEENKARDVLSSLSSPEDYYPWHVFESSLTIGVTERGLNKLRNNSLVVSITVPQEVRQTLAESVPLINATTAWSQRLSGTNITGLNTTVCIVDSGINPAHPDLNGKIIAQKCFCDHNILPGLGGCCPNGGETEDNASDNSGHGTHVAGIVAANGNLKGVAPEAKIVSVRVLDNDGNGTDSDVALGIQWCKDNKDAYKISLITVSIGGERFSTACDANQSAAQVNLAVSSGLFVSVASGNDGNITHITNPACASNATAVGMTYDKGLPGSTICFGGDCGTSQAVCNDESPTTDQIVCLSNRASLLDLVAPGYVINSTNITGYKLDFGTSMAAPHVAGAAALLIQYWKLKNNRTLLPFQIEELLKGTGKFTYDTNTSLNFSRIDVSAALFPVDVYNLSMINLTDAAKVFKFRVRNQNNSYQNLSFGLELGNGTWVNTSNLSVPPKKDVLVFVEHNYTQNGTYDVTAWASNGREWNDSEHLVFSRGWLSVYNLSTVGINNTERTFRFKINNTNASINITGLNWTVDFGDGVRAVANALRTIANGTEHFFYLWHNYAAGSYWVNVTAGNSTVSGVARPLQIAV